LVDDDVIDAGISTDEVFREEDAKCPTNDDIIVIILVLDDTDAVLSTPPKNIYCLHNMSIGSLIEQQIAHVFQCIGFLRFIKQNK
jgi:hypothetical protein